MSPKTKRDPKRRAIRSKYRDSINSEKFKALLKKHEGFATTKEVVKSLGWSDLGFMVIRDFTKAIAKKGVIKLVRKKKNIIGYALPGVTVPLKSAKSGVSKKVRAPKTKKVSKPKLAVPVESAPEPAPAIPAVG